jgi:type IV secretion system protein VirB5
MRVSIHSRLQAVISRKGEASDHKGRFGKIAIALVVFLSLYVPSTAHSAGIPVIDAASISQDAANFARELQEMLNQIQTMKDQLSQQIKQYESLVGDRGMGGLLNNQIKNYIPETWKDALAVLDRPSGYSSLSSKAQQYINENKVLSDEKLEKFDPKIREIVEEERKALATQKALAEAAYENASERFAALQTLVNNIGAATDPKAILDLQARIQAEEASLKNESIKLQAMSESLRVEEIIRQQKIREFLANSTSRIE